MCAPAVNVIAPSLLGRISTWQPTCAAALAVRGWRCTWSMWMSRRSTRRPRTYPSLSASSQRYSPGFQNFESMKSTRSPLTTAWSMSATRLPGKWSPWKIRVPGMRNSDSSASAVLRSPITPLAMFSLLNRLRPWDNAPPPTPKTCWTTARRVAAYGQKRLTSTRPTPQKPISSRTPGEWVATNTSIDPGTPAMSPRTTSTRSRLWPGPILSSRSRVCSHQDNSSGLNRGAAATGASPDGIGPSSVDACGAGGPGSVSRSCRAGLPPTRSGGNGPVTPRGGAAVGASDSTLGSEKSVVAVPCSLGGYDSTDDGLVNNQKS